MRPHTAGSRPVADIPVAFLCLAILASIAGIGLLAAGPAAAAEHAMTTETGQGGEVGKRLAAVATQPAGAGRSPTVTIALLPNGTGIRRLARVPGIAPGLMSAGLGRVLPDQTYLDISQGARAFNSLYNVSLPLVLPRGDRVPDWHQIVERAESAPGEITPGLFASYLTARLQAEGRLGAARSAVVMERELVVPALMGAGRSGRIVRDTSACRTNPCEPPVTVRNATVRDLPLMIEEMGEHDLLIAIERPPPEERGMLSVGIAGPGYGGNLTSATTRTAGYVLATDLAPTVIDFFGFEVPEQMTGRPIRSTASRDVAALVSLEERMKVVAPRRGPVLGVAIVAWLAALLLTLAADLALSRSRPRQLERFTVALQLLALSGIYLPAVLLLAAALRPELGAERLVVVLGCPLLAALTLVAMPGWRAVAIACAVTTISHAVDVVSGSPLISLSLLGPNPGLGVRFYGIGNELGATLSVLILIGIGSALAGFAPQLDRRFGALIFLAGALVTAAIFAAGRFGADVGSAMVIPASAVVAAAVLTRRRWLAIAALAVPAAGLALLVAIDLVSGGDSHFQRTVLDSRGGDLIDTVARRLRLTGRSFVRAASGPFLPLTALVIALGVGYRTRIGAWLRAAPPAFLAGFLGAGFAAVLGTIVNDSGVLLLEVGTAYLMLMTGYAWAEYRRSGAGSL